MASSFLRDDNWLPKPEHAPTVAGQRDHLLEVRWGSGKVTLRNPGGDRQSYIGGSGEPGLLLVLRKGASGYVARLEDRKAGNSWAGSQPKSSPQIALANLQRELKRVTRAVGVKGTR